MRLICPNCGAQYEVGADVVPPAGRDLQCSNCSHTWFERPGASEARLLDRQRQAAPPEPEPAPEPAPAPEPSPEPAPDPARPPVVPGTEAAEAPSTAAQAPDASFDRGPTPEGSPPDTSPDTPPDTPQPGDGPRRQTLAPELAAILREEREREEAARNARAGSLESQPELGLDAPETGFDSDSRRNEEARRRLARMRGEAAPTPAAEIAAATAATTRRDLLPDIEEINSSLRADADNSRAAAAQPDAEARKRRGFRFGFSTVLIIAAIATAVYLYAGPIGDRLPAAAPALGAYVDGVNAARLWLDLRLQDLTAMLSTSEDVPAQTPEG